MYLFAFFFCLQECRLFLLTLQNYDEKWLVPRNLSFFTSSLYDNYRFSATYRGSPL